MYIYIYTLGYPGFDLLWVSMAVAGCRCVMYDASLHDSLIGLVF